jgi:hypothetical protein
MRESKTTPVGRLRERLELTQEKMAFELQCAQSSIYDAETKGPPGRRLGFLIWDLWRDELHELRISLDDLLRPFPSPPRDDSRPAA